MYIKPGEFDGIGGDVASPPQALPEAPPLGRPCWRTRIEHRYHALDIAHDLAEEIGSARWYRGFATVIALCTAALAFWPDFSAVEAATTVRAEMRQEFHSHAIAPLARGADSGRRPALELPSTARLVPLASVPERATIKLVATLGAGDTLARMLQRAGVGAADASGAADLIAAVMAREAVKPGTRFDVTLGQRPAPGEPRPLDRLAFRARFDLDLAVERQGGSLGIAKQAVQVDATPLRIRGTVGSSLYRSARAAGAPMQAIAQYLQTIAAHLNDGDIAPTDEFDMIVAYKRAPGGESEVGQLVYAGLEREGKPRAQLVRWNDGRFVDAAAMAQPQVYSSGGGMVSPVNGRMTSPYGARRHPILGYVRMHAGIDFGAPWGSPIFAVSDGVVAFAGRHGGHGNYVKLDHGGGLGTGYGHMSRIAVSSGARVRAGQVIGYVGSTGLSTGPHLHYEAYQNGRTVNPASVSFSFRSVAVADKGEVDAVKGKIAALKKVAPGAALQKLAPRY